MNHVALAGMVLLTASGLAAQHVISARSGLVNYVEGEVALAGKQIVPKAGEFPEMKKGDTLRTTLGRAELLLGPGAFLRVSENSEVRFTSTQLEDTRIDLLAGSILIEAGDFDSKYNGIVVNVGGTSVEVVKRGLFRIDADPAGLKVFEGVATVVSGGQTTSVKEGRQTAFSAVPMPVKFDKDRGDAFHRWAARRSGYIAMANITAAKRISDNMTTWRVSNWIYNPYFGSFTYIPANGMWRSPFGWSYYSPNTVQRVYYRPPTVYNPPSSMAGFGGAASGSSRSYSGYSGGSSMGTYASGGTAAAPAPSSAPAPAAGGERSGGDSGGGRSTAGGR